MNQTGSVSAVTLDDDWSRLSKLLLAIVLAALGCIGNILVISSIIIDNHLKKSSNSLIASIAVADLLVSGFVFPVTAVVLLADASSSSTLCKTQWFIAVLNFLVIMVCSMMIATENYCRLCFIPEKNVTASPSGRIQYKSCGGLTPKRAYSVVVTTWSAAVVVSSFQVTRIGFDYCGRSHSGLFAYQLSVTLFLVFVPALVAVVSYSKALIHVRALLKRNDLKRSMAFSCDYDLMKSNICCFVVFLLFWSPFGCIIATNSIKKVSGLTLYKWAWFGFSKSCLNPYLYCLTNRCFRESYVKLFKYCCCKSSTAVPRRHRSDVRVRISHRYPYRSRTSSSSAYQSSDSH